VRASFEAPWIGPDPNAGTGISQLAQDRHDLGPLEEGTHIGTPLYRHAEAHVLVNTEKIASIHPHLL